MADKYLNITGKLVKLIDAGDGTFFLATKSSTAETLMGAKTDAAATVADATPFSIIALLKGIFAKLLGTLNVQLSGSIVADHFEGSATVTRTYTNDHTGLEICNDGVASLTFTVDSLAGRIFTVLAGDVIDEQYPPFKVIVITTAVAYRATVKGGTVEVGVSG